MAGSRTNLTGDPLTAVIVFEDGVTQVQGLGGI